MRLFNVLALPGEPGCYIVDIETDDDAFHGYVARPGGGGLCDTILEQIASGAFEGNISEFVPPPPRARRVAYSKAALFQAMTDAEYDAMETAVAGLSARRRAVFENTRLLDSADETVADIRAALAALIGEPRVEELFASATHRPAPFTPSSSPHRQSVTPTTGMPRQFERSTMPSKRRGAWS